MSHLPVEEEADQVRLPDVVYSLLIDKHLDDSSCTALAMSEACDGFSPLYTTSRKTKGLVVDHKSSYFTPDSWRFFIKQYISLDSIKVLNLNNLYWLPSQLLVSTIMQMPMLEELSIKGTQVCTICQVAKILKANPKIVKLDFTYTEKIPKDVWEGLREETTPPTGSSSFGAYLESFFQRLTSVKMSTTVLDAKNNFVQDPWRLVIFMLTCCRDCKELSIEITYSGDYEDDHLETTELAHIRSIMRSRLFPLLKWMKCLNSLVFIKLGSASTEGEQEIIHSHVLDELLGWLFPVPSGNPKPVADRPHRTIWIQDFRVFNSLGLAYADSECLESFRSRHDGMYYEPEKVFEGFHNLVQLDRIGRVAPSESLLYSKLKYLSIVISFDDKEIHKFCKLHPNLERLCVDCPLIAFPPSDVVFKLPKLKSFSFKRYDISQAFLEAIADAYPNLENLQLIKTYNTKSDPSDEIALSAISFSKLTSLSLRGFQLRDGAFLLEIIDKCPKLEILHLETDSLEVKSFLPIFKQFLCKAINLREFRLKWDHKEDDYPTTVLSILNDLLGNEKSSEKSLLIEQLVLIDDGESGNSSPSPPPPGFSDRLLEFTSKMKHLTCCCITSNQMDPDLMTEIKNRVELEVVTERPSLWFHLGREIPQASDAGVPLIHYHQIVEPVSFVLPRL